MLRIRLLGQYSIHLGDRPIEIPFRPAQALLAYLLVHPGAAHPREKLAGMFWPEASEANARSSLRHALWRIRKSLTEAGAADPVWLQSDHFSITFHPTPEVWVDVAELLAEPSGNPATAANNGNWDESCTLSFCGLQPRPC